MFTAVKGLASAPPEIPAYMLIQVGLPDGLMDASAPTNPPIPGVIPISPKAEYPPRSLALI
ncbi:hypothetical protein GUA46_06855 [Muricauda sp. HICW]|uniref:Uncharacterized protein n=1 Tax=Flagellimonas chongwuensis TaxID=2697365 RepID=A0A850NBK5_9FLAO|nr:hypothetical protein [Allomuricauda chongwuensis]NVN18053.1 hypothetical protein [Allomuricauda chongwuensis]